MAAPQVAPLPQDFVLESGMQVVITAIDSSTGNLVANVTVANVSLSVDTSLSPDENTVGVAAPILVPSA
jgi:hypothetical protein